MPQTPCAEGSAHSYLFTSIYLNLMPSGLPEKKDESRLPQDSPRLEKSPKVSSDGVPGAYSVASPLVPALLSSSRVRGEEKSKSMEGRPPEGIIVKGARRVRKFGRQEARFPKFRASRFLGNLPSPSTRQYEEFGGFCRREAGRSAIGNIFPGETLTMQRRVE